MTNRAAAKLNSRRPLAVALRADPNNGPTNRVAPLRNRPRQPSPRPPRPSRDPARRPRPSAANLRPRGEKCGLAQLGWLNKRWVTLKQESLGGNTFTKTSLHALLTNPLYVGQVTYKKELHQGQQPRIVAAEVWKQVQALLAKNYRQQVNAKPKDERMLLQRLLRCRNCNCSMTPVTASKQGKKKYRYYVCLSAQKRGWDTCPSKSIPALEIEQFVVDQLRATTLPAFTTWDTLSPADQIELLRSLVAEVAYDGALQSVAVTLKDESTEQDPLEQEQLA